MDYQKLEAIKLPTLSNSEVAIVKEAIAALGSTDWSLNINGTVLTREEMHLVAHLLGFLVRS